MKKHLLLVAVALALCTGQTGAYGGYSPPQPDQNEKVCFGEKQNFSLCYTVTPIVTHEYEDVSFVTPEQTQTHEYCEEMLHNQSTAGLWYRGPIDHRSVIVTIKLPIEESIKNKNTRIKIASYLFFGRSTFTWCA